MSLPTVDVVRVNTVCLSFNSVRVTVDNQPIESFVGVDWQEERETRQIASNSADALPIGMSRGKYKIERFPLRVLTDGSNALKRYLTAKAATQGFMSLSDATFILGVQLSGLDAGDYLPSITAFASCRVLGEKRVHAEGVDELVTELTIGCLGATQDGTSLWSATAGTPLDPFPGVDSITLNNVQMPGKWTLRPGSKKYGWEVRKGTFMSGATVVPTGDDLIEAEFDVEIWDPVDLLAFNIARAGFLTKALIGVPGVPIAVALGIDHPELAQLGCSSVVVKECPWLTNDGYGVWVGTVKFLQYRPPLLALGKPTSATPGVVAPVPTATTAAEKALVAAQADLAALGGA